MAETVCKSWRELCAVAVDESDPEKLAALVRQILEAFDESDQRMQPTANTMAA